MKIIGSVLDFEAISTRIKIYTKLEGSYVVFKIFLDTTIIFSNKIQIATFKKLYAKMTKVMAKLDKELQDG